MKVLILQEDLTKILNTALRFTANRGTLPILGNFLLKTDKTKLIIHATNLEISISLSLGAKVEEEGTVTVPAKPFTEIISTLGTGQIELNLDKEKLFIKKDSFQAYLPVTLANDFPKIEESIDPAKSLSLEVKNLKKVLSKVLFAASSDDTRPVLSGVLFIFDAPKADSSTLTLVASDGFRLARKTINIDKKHLSTDMKMIIPRSTLVELLKLTENIASITLEPRAEENQLIIKIDDIFLTTRLIDGNFPDFEKIIPTAPATHIVLDKAEFLKEVKLAGIFVRSTSNIIKLSVTKDFLEVSAEGSSEGNEKGKLDLKFTGDSLDILFNHKFIEEFLNLAEGESVEIKLVDPISPAIFIDPKDPDLLHLIMPVRIQT